MNKKLLIAVITFATLSYTSAAIKKLTSMDDFERACKSIEPCVIVFNSATCTACDSMEQAMEEIIKEYPQCSFYSVQSSDEAFKDLDKNKLQIKAWPTTHFIKKGKVERNERGAMSAYELDQITYQLVNGKPKPQPKMQPKVEEKAQSTPAA